MLGEAMVLWQLELGGEMMVEDYSKWGGPRVYQGEV